MGYLRVSSREVKEVMMADQQTSGKNKQVDRRVICRRGLDWKMKCEMPMEGIGGGVMQVVGQQIWNLKDNFGLMIHIWELSVYRYYLSQGSG